jgi:hypothetical protein
LSKEVFAKALLECEKLLLFHTSPGSWSRQGTAREGVVDSTDNGHCLIMEDIS